MAELEQIEALVAEAKQLFDNGDISKEEFQEILEDIKRVESIEEMSDDTVLKGQILTALNIATYVV
jgi:argininosuccinate lyase